MSETSRSGSDEMTGSSQPETASPYAGLSHEEVITLFVDSRGNEPGIGRELSSRLIKHAGIDIDPTTKPLMHHGEQVTSDDGRPLTWADYVDWASGRLSSSYHHSRHAMFGVLSFLQSEPGTPEYEAGREGMEKMIEQNARAS